MEMKVQEGGVEGEKRGETKAARKKKKVGGAKGAFM